MRAKDLLHQIVGLLQAEVAMHSHGGPVTDPQTLASIRLLVDKLTDHADIELNIVKATSAASGKGK